MTTRQRRRTSRLSTERERLEMEWSTRDVSRPANKPPVHVPASHSADTGTSGGDDRGAPPARVLVVEDEESFVDALTVNLEREGFFVTVARDGVEALERFAADQPDLVLLDVMLPRLSGIDVCRAIRANSTVPIIMVTAKSTELDTVVGLEVPTTTSPSPTASTSSCRACEPFSAGPRLPTQAPTWGRNPRVLRPPVRRLTTGAPREMRPMASSGRRP